MAKMPVLGVSLSGDLKRMLDGFGAELLSIDPRSDALIDSRMREWTFGTLLPVGERIIQNTSALANQFWNRLATAQNSS
jgi:hypothetical protein